MSAMIDLKLDELETRNKLAVIWLLEHFHQIDVISVDISGMRVLNTLIR